MQHLFQIHLLLILMILCNDKQTITLNQLSIALLIQVAEHIIQCLPFFDLSVLFKLNVQ